MAGIKDDITPGHQRLALHGFINAPNFAFVPEIPKLDKQLLAYFIRAYDCEVLADFTESSGKRCFPNVGRPTKDNKHGLLRSPFKQAHLFASF
jgi:hypothetical protein